MIGNSGAATGASVTISPKTATVAVNKTVALSAQTLPGNRPVTFASSATTTATVSEAGVVKGVAAGTATITVSATIDGSTYTDTATITVTT